MSTLPVSVSRRRVWLLATSLLAVIVAFAGLLLRSRRSTGPPYSPEQALRTITVHSGFHLESFASEPLIASPVAMDWDENGRIYVAEDTGYPLDTRPTGRIVLLEDTNADGIPDRRTVFADHIVMPNSVMCWKGGVLVTAAPDVWFFKDTTGNGKADVREKVLTGFAFTNPQHMVNGPLYGPDNWIYLNHQGPIHTVVFQDPFGDRGSDIRFADGQGPKLKMAPRSVRFRPDTHQLEFLSGWSQYGQAFDEWGRQFTITNDRSAFSSRRRALYVAPASDQTSQCTILCADSARHATRSNDWMAADTYRAGYLYNGQDRGRIYRIVPDTGLPLSLPKNIRLGRASDVELIEQLASPNIWWRRTAQRLLVERRHPDAVAPLVRFLEQTKSPLGRVHALWTLDGLGKLDSSLVAKALDDPVAGVRENAIRLAEPYLTKAPELAQKLTQMAGETDPKVRFQLLCTLGFVDSAESVAAQKKLLADGIEDPWMQVAALSAPASRALPYFEMAVSRFVDSETKGHRDFFHRVGAVIGMKADGKEMRRLVTTVARSSRLNSDWWGGATLDGMAEGVRANGANAKAALKQDRDLFLQMFVRRPGSVGHAAVHLLAVLGLPNDSAAAEALERAESIAADRKADAAERADALDLLALANSDREAHLLEKLLDPAEPDSVQIAAVRALNSARGPKVGPLLLAKWNGMSAPVRAQATNTLLSGGSDRVLLLLEAVKKGDVQTWQLDPYKPRLFMDPDPAVRQLARALFEQSSAQREQALKQYQAALNMSGDVKRGKDTFTRVCSRCHELDGVGVAVGPNLGTVRNHPASALLVDIIMPSKSIEQGYETYVVELTSGDIVDGIMSAQTPATITLRQEQGRETVIARQDIKTMRVSKVSMMPEGLERQISVDQMADLLTFLKAVR